VTALRVARVLLDYVRVHLGVALWRFGDWSIGPRPKRWPRTRWQTARFEVGCAIAGAAELVIGRRMLLAAHRLRFPQDYRREPASDYERRTW
jgi:hypothetical protein